MLNQCVFIGRLVRDPELKYTQGQGVALTTFTLAVDQPFAREGEEKKADFIDITVWRKQAEACAKYLQKGSMCAVVGRLEIRSYTDKEDIKRKAASIIAENVRFLGGVKSKEDADLTKSENWDGKEISSDDVPF